MVEGHNGKSSQQTVLRKEERKVQHAKKSLRCSRKLQQKPTGSTKRLSMSVANVVFTIQGSGARPTLRVGENFWRRGYKKQQKKTDG